MNKMTDKLHEAAEQALDALVDYARLLGVTQAKIGFGCYTPQDAMLERAWHASIAKHIAFLRTAIAVQPAEQEPEGNVCGRCGGLVFDPVLPQPVKPAEQEPVAWTDEDYTNIYVSKDIAEDMNAHVALYTDPQSHRRLTDEEILALGKAARAVEGQHILPVTFARAIEDAIWSKT
jgi:hypothetical protein